MNYSTDEINNFINYNSAQPKNKQEKGKIK